MNIQVEYCGDTRCTAKELNQFNFNPQNRQVKPARVRSIIKKIYDAENKVWAQVQPIEVNLVTNNITDGAGRKVGFMTKINDGGLPADTTVPVRFVKIPAEQEVEYIQIINKDRTGWSTEDFVLSNVTAGNENYRMLQTFCLEHELLHDENNTPRYRAGAAILGKGRKEHQLKNKQYVFPLNDVPLADQVHDELKLILDTIGWMPTRANLEAMAKSWYKYRDNHPMDKWLKAISKHKNGPSTANSPAVKAWDNYFLMCSGELTTKCRRCK